MSDDFMGKQLHSIQGQAAHINNIAAGEIKKLHAGFYLVNVLEGSRVVASRKVSRL